MEERFDNEEKNTYVYSSEYQSMDSGNGRKKKNGFGKGFLGGFVAGFVLIGVIVGGLAVGRNLAGQKQPSQSIHHGTEAAGTENKDQQTETQEPQGVITEDFLEEI
ncbi:MAG: hypothetical protein J6I64_04415, partial [Lachnospiraceae bacterium]|nr:hypothetical protein [Lachnospiraceae bacterium]